MDKIIKIKDVQFAHCGSSTIYLPKTMRWDWSDPTDDEICVYTDSTLTQYRRGNPNNIAWLIEPREISFEPYNWIISNHIFFKEVWTHDAIILGTIPDKARYVPFGGCWIEDKDRNIYNKFKNISIIASDKKWLPGHALRHLVIEKFSNHIDCYGRFGNPIDNKIDALRDYRFSIVIENVKKDFWFTEKIIDCFMTGTIPIYWGCPSIDSVFYKDGMIIVDSLEDIGYAIDKCTPELYQSKIHFIEKNFELAKQYCSAEDWMVQNNYI